MTETKTTSDNGASKTLAVFVVLLAAGLSLAITLAWLGRVILLLLFAAIVVAVF